MKIVVLVAFFAFLSNPLQAEQFDCSVGCFVKKGEVDSKKYRGREISKKPISNFIKPGESNHISLCRNVKRRETCSDSFIFVWPKGLDSDKDGLSDILENELKTNPNQNDSDLDGLSDGEEYFLWGDKESQEDFDDDGLINILDPKSLGDEYLDSSNPELREIRLVVVNEENKDKSIYSFFDVLPPKTLIKAKKTDVTFSWRHNTDGAIGYRLYYRTYRNTKAGKVILPIKIGASENKEKFNGTGLDQGNSPIDVGWENKIKISGMDSSAVYEFNITAYDSQGEESDFAPPLRIVGVVVEHIYPDKNEKSTVWIGPGNVKFNSKEVDNVLKDVIVNGKSLGPIKNVSFKVDTPGKKIIFIYR